MFCAPVMPKPRMSTVVVAALLPKKSCMTMPACSASRSGTVFAGLARMSSAVMTVRLTGLDRARALLEARRGDDHRFAAREGHIGGKNAASRAHDAPQWLHNLDNTESPSPRRARRAPRMTHGRREGRRGPRPATEETPRRRPERATPRLIHRFRFGPVYGLTRLTARRLPRLESPVACGARSRFRLGPPLAYRCGGSTGVTPVSRLTSDANCSRGTRSGAAGTHSRTARRQRGDRNTR